MLWMLLACLDPPPDAQLTGGASPAIEGLPLPEETPFPALSRVRPVTLVDERGQTLLVLKPLGVALTVKRLLPNRALVDCTGCRAPLEGWVQRATLLPLTGVDDHPELTPDDRMLLWLAGAATPEQAAVLAHGLVPVDRGEVAPPWHAEGGYEGPILEVLRRGDGWTLGAAPQGEQTP